MMILSEDFYKEDSNNYKNKISASTLKLINQLQHEDFFAFMSLSDLEDFLDLSTRNLQLLFKKNFQITPTQFLREQKIKYAKRLILESKGSLNVTQISTEIGFLNFSAFAKYYKEYHGVTPSQTIKNLK